MSVHSTEVGKTHRDRKTQLTRLIELLIKASRERGGGWVPAPELAAISLMYTARIREIRHDLKLRVESRVEVVKGVKHGFYRLVLGAPAPAVTSTPAPAREQICSAPPHPTRRIPD
jgi:hypothetical protein